MSDQADNDSLEQHVRSILKQKSQLVQERFPQFLLPTESFEEPELREFSQMVWDYNLRGGKRMRPALCLLSTEAFGGDSQKALPTAVGLELLQNFLLVHDDIEDESELRRGKPCLHKIYGIPAAINAGDALFCKCFEALEKNRQLLGAGKTLKIMREFIAQLNRTVEGQAMELAWIRNNKWDMTEKQYFKLVELKTAHYTITTPLKLGAIIAGASAKDVNALVKIGMQLGTAFQIVDDALNLSGEQAKIGKEIAGDLLEAKRTLVLIHLLKKCTPKEREFVQQALSRPRSEKDAHEIESVMQLITEKQSVQYALAKARELSTSALENFKAKFAHVPNLQAKKDLLEVLEFAVTRTH